jgi:hypothetical protein
MQYEEFHIRSREEAAAFQALLQRHLPRLPEHWSFAEAFDHLGAREPSKRLQTALLDLLLTYAAVHAESGDWVASHSRAPRHGSVHDDARAFAARFDKWRAASSFLIRTRALWDKVMGFLVLYHCPERHEEYRKGRKGSRRKAFRVIAAGGAIPSLSEDDLKVMNEIVDALSTVRDAEAHWEGTIRKWAFSTALPHETPEVDLLLTHWNSANHLIANLMSLCMGPSKAQSASDPSASGVVGVES